MTAVAVSAFGYYMKTNFSLFYEIPWIILCAVVYLVSITFLGVVKKTDLRTIEKSGIKIPQIVYRIAR
jgi:hypothetical protein